MEKMKKMYIEPSMQVVNIVERECMLAGSGEEISLPIVKPKDGEPKETVNEGLAKEHTYGWDEYCW